MASPFLSHRHSKWAVYVPLLGKGEDKEKKARDVSQNSTVSRQRTVGLFLFFFGLFLLFLFYFFFLCTTFPLTPLPEKCGVFSTLPRAVFRKVS